MKRKALLIPFNSKQQIFIQDRDGHKPPPWGFFGGGIEENESPLQAVIREIKEELDLDLLEADLEYLGEFPTQFSDQQIERSVFLYRTDQKEFTVLEGAGGKWLSFASAAEKLDTRDKLEEIKQKICK